MTIQEIVRPVIDEMLQETAGRMHDVPSDLNKTYARRGGWVGFVTGATSGGYFGAGLGIAGGPLGAIAGTIPGALIGAIVGYFCGDKVGSNFPNEE